MNVIINDSPLFARKRRTHRGAFGIAETGGGAILAPDLSSDNLYSSYSGSKYDQGRIKASAGPGAVPNEGPLQTYNQVITPINCGPPKLRARVLQHP